MVEKKEGGEEDKATRIFCNLARYLLTVCSCWSLEWIFNYLSIVHFQHLHLTLVNDFARV